MNLKIGIDLATRQTGIVARLETGAIVGAEVVILQNKPLNEINKRFYKLFSNIKKAANQEVSPYLGLEISNYGNPQLTQKFSLLGGVVLSNYGHVFLNGEYKIFNAAEGFIKLFKKTNPNKSFVAKEGKRTDRKNLSVESFKKVYKKEIDLTREQLEDIADAFGISYFYNDCLDTAESYELHKKQFKELEKWKKRK